MPSLLEFIVVGALIGASIPILYHEIRSLIWRLNRPPLDVAIRDLLEYRVREAAKKTAENW